ncbi:MAG TPA: hypothetical protein VF247_09690, partial [Candidatus Krumholzibacteria bacterium]
MKRIFFLGISVVSVLILLAVFGVRRVSPDEQAVKVKRNGAVARADAGWHFVGPGAELVKYPAGGWRARVPAKGTTPVTFSNGDTAGVAFDFTLDIPVGSAEALYRGFSRDFTPAF